MSATSLSPCQTKLNDVCQRGKKGSALLIVLLLLSLMGTLMVSNSVILRRLKLELQRIEQKQQRIDQPAAAPGQPQAPLEAR